MELRPLSIGELLDRTFSYYRSHFWLFVGIVAAPQVAMVAVSLFIQSLRITSPAPPPPSRDPAEIFARFPGMIAGFAITMVVLMLAAVVIYSLIQGAVAFALSEVHQGRATTITAAFRNLRGKTWRLIDVVVSIGLRLIGIYVLLFLGVVLVVAVPAALSVGGKPNPILMVILGLLAFVGVMAGMVLGFVLMMRYALAVPALVLENLNARQAIKRSVKLAKGNTWKIFLIFLLMYMISAVVVSIFQGPFLVATIVIAARHAMPPLWLQILSTISGGIGGALSGPLIAIALTLLYFDARVRKEGYDLQLMMAGLSPEASGAETAPIITPQTT